MENKIAGFEDEHSIVHEIAETFVNGNITDAKQFCEENGGSDMKHKVYDYLKEMYGDNEADSFRRNVYASENKIQEKIGMWINSKLMLDEEGNLKEANKETWKEELQKEAWNFDKKKDDDKEESDDKEEKKDDDEKDCSASIQSSSIQSSSIKLSSEEYSELESFINKIAAEKGIEDVSEISINLNKEAGIIEFKIANEDVGKKKI